MTPRHLLACALLACASLLPFSSRANGAEPPVAIDLRPQGALWEVRYALPHPAPAMRFVRVDREGHRAERWTPVDPAFEIVLEDGEEVVRRRDRAAFDRVAFRMEPRYIQLEKDYAPFSPFGDGGLLIHTGRFHACAVQCNGGERFLVTLQPPAGAHAIAGGEVVPAVRLVEGDDGTNLYVGRAEPVVTEDVVAVIDAAFPTATRERLEALLPRLMAFYGERFGALDSRPMLFVSRDESSPGGGYGFQGGTLPGQVFMHLYGRNPAFATPEFAARLDWFFAHETAHMYQRYPPLADAGDSWIHEGGADALAAIALQALGETDASAVDARVQSSLEACAAAIATHPLNRAHTEGSFDAFYTCGFVMQMVADAAARRASGGACGLVCIWKAFQARVAAGEPWNSDTFIAVVGAHADPETARFLRQVVETVPDRPADFLRDGLDASR